MTNEYVKGLAAAAMIAEERCELGVACVLYKAALEAAGLLGDPQSEETPVKGWRTTSEKYAIKRVRDYTGWSLKEAKKYVDKYRKPRFI